MARSRCRSCLSSHRPESPLTAAQSAITRRQARGRPFSSTSARTGWTSPTRYSSRRLSRPRAASREVDLIGKDDMQVAKTPAAAKATRPPKAEVLDAELLADFGHQLRNQLNAILGAAGLLSMTAASNEERELASIVERGSEQVARLVGERRAPAMTPR